MYKFSYKTGGFIYIENFLEYDSLLFEIIKSKSSLHNEFIRLVGSSEIQLPRKVDYFGDKEYKYSGIKHEPKEFFKELKDIREKIVENDKLYKIISKESLSKLNSCLINYYEDGNDYVSFHSDDEKELGPNNEKNILVASVSLGESRLFSIQSKNNNDFNIVLNLKSGSLLLMYGDFQKKFEHSILKTKEKKKERINLTYRVIL